MAVVAGPSRRSPLRLALAVVGAIVSLVLIAIGAFMLLDLAARHSFRTAVHYAGVRTLIVHNGAGDVTLHSVPAGGALTVRENETESLARPKVRSEMAGNGTLTLTAACPGRLQCSVNYELSVPRNVAIQVSSGFGNIDATGLASTSSIQLGTTAGDIDANGLSAPDIRLSTGLGGVTAVVTQPPRRLTANTGAGTLNLTVPNVTYAVRATSSLGHVSDAAVRVDPAAPRSIDVNSSVGDVTISVSP